MKQRTRPALIFGCILVLMTLFMMAYTVTGLMLPSLTAYYGLTVSQSGMVASLQYGGETLILVISGFLPQGAAKEKRIAGCFVGTVLVLLGMSLHPPFPVLLWCFLAFGVCSGRFTYYAASYIAELFPENRGRYMTIFYISVSVGCMAAPYYPTWRLDRGAGWWTVYGTEAGVISIFTLVFMLTLLFCRQNPPEPPAAPAERGAAPPFRFLFQKGSGRLVLLCLMALLYMGHQISLTAWLPTYLGDSLGGSAGFSGVVLSLFAAGLVAGRVLYAAVSSRVRAEHFLLAATILGSIVLGAGLLIRSGPAILIAMLFTGIFTGALNPVLTSLGCDWYPQNTGAAAGLICLSLSVGGMAFPYLVGRIAQRFSLFAAIFLAAVDLLLIAVLLAVSMAQTRSMEKQQGRNPNGN